MSSTDHFARQLCASSELLFEPSALFGKKRSNKIMYQYIVKADDIERLKQAAKSSDEWTVNDITLEPTVSRRKMGYLTLQFDVGKARGVPGKEKWVLAFLLPDKRYVDYVDVMRNIVNEILPQTKQWATGVQFRE